MSTSITALLIKYYKVFITLIVLVVYSYTLAPSVVQIDAGELASAQYMCGIAHPTGYPLFILLGYLFTHLPLPLTPVYLSNLLAAIWTAAGVYYFMGILEIVNVSFVHQEMKKLKNHIKFNSSDFDSKRIQLVTISIGGVLFAFNKIIWLQSTSVEVYSLHIVLLTATLYYFLRTVLTAKTTESESISKRFVAYLPGCVLLALGFTNHMSIVFAVPGVLYLFFRREGLSRKSIQLFGLLTLIILCITVAFYTMLMLRSMQQPVVNWGSPNDLSSLIFHIQGKQYAEAFFKSIEDVEFNLMAFVRTIPIIFSIPPLLALPLGLLMIKKVRFELIVFLALLFFTNLLFAINYQIWDLMTYFILCYVVMHVLIFLGLKYLENRLSSLKRGLFIAVVFFIGIAIYQFIDNRGVSHRNLYAYEDYSKSVLNSLPKNTVLFSSVRYDWDFLVGPLYYFQTVEKQRPDVIQVNAGLLGRPWYLKQLLKSHPGIFEASVPEIEQFIATCEEYDKNISDVFLKNQAVEHYTVMVKALVQKTIAKAPISITYNFLWNEMNNQNIIPPTGYGIVPDFFVYRIKQNPNEYSPLPQNRINIRFPEIPSEYILRIKNTTANILYERAMVYEKIFNKPEMQDNLLKLINTDLNGAEIVPRFEFNSDKNQ